MKKQITLLMYCTGAHFVGRSKRKRNPTPFLWEKCIMFGGNFAPRGWAFCDGQLLAISTTRLLCFRILGTTYGGDGRTTFGLPDLRGRAALLRPGRRPRACTRRRLGEKVGSESVTLSAAQMPSHSHLSGTASSAGIDLKH